VPVDHAGNTYECDEEAEVIRKIVAELSSHVIEEAATAPRRITVKDILVVAPFNFAGAELRDTACNRVGCALE